MQTAGELQNLLVKHFGERIDDELRSDPSIQFPNYFGLLVDDIRQGLLPIPPPTLTLREAESVVQEFLETLGRADLSDYSTLPGLGKILFVQAFPDFIWSRFGHTLRIDSLLLPKPNCECPNHHEGQNDASRARPKSNGTNSNACL
jgi:hypothetical protein